MLTTDRASLLVTYVHQGTSNHILEIQLEQVHAGSSIENSSLKIELSGYETLVEELAAIPGITDSC